MIDPAALQSHYSHFRVAERLLMTGHSHQAWPDVAREGQMEAWDDAARDVDGKWEAAYRKADRVRDGWRGLLNDGRSGEIVLGPNTHELLARFLSGIDWSKRNAIVTTDAEFHTVRRQVDRLNEAGWVDVRKVEGRPVESVVERLLEEVRDHPACLIVSSVYFGTAEVVPALSTLADACIRHGVELLVDSYHHLGIVPFSVKESGLDQAYITGGGYKYTQMGEGNCFLRFPKETRMRPVFTGWFAEFAELAERKQPNEVPYGKGPARFMGATYDPVSHYRAASVLDFFAEQGLTVERLRELNQHQLRRLAAGFASVLGADDPSGSDRFPGLRRGWENVGGFLAVRTDHAAELHQALKAEGVLTDFRGELLRFGPAPYVTDAQIDAVIEKFGAAVGSVGI